MSEKVCPKCGSKNIENHRDNPDDHGLIWIDHWICKNCGKSGFKPADASYNQLEDIVPSLALCKKIPAGLFEKSALIWGRYGKDWWVNAREFDSTPNKAYPAPTLAEIIKELKPDSHCTAEVIGINYSIYLDLIENKWVFEMGEKNSVADDPATAALKLWLELNKEEKEK